jgi:hypothetical protein
LNIARTAIRIPMAQSRLPDYCRTSGAASLFSAMVIGDFTLLAGAK